MRRVLCFAIALVACEDGTEDLSAQDGGVEASHEDATASDPNAGYDGGSCLDAACASGSLCVYANRGPGTCVPPDDAGICFAPEETGWYVDRRVGGPAGCCFYFEKRCKRVAEACEADLSCGCLHNEERTICPMAPGGPVTGSGCMCEEVTGETARCRCLTP